MRRIAYPIVLVIVATALGVVGAAQPAAASTCGTAHIPSDFNGDGIADVAVSDAPANGVLILYGTRTGLTVHASGTAPATQTLTINSNLEPGNSFVVATGDFNGDGCADLAVGDVHTVPTPSRSGVIEVFYGSPAGFTASGTILDAASVSGQKRRAYEYFGTALAAGDFNHDGYDDLAVGAPGASTPGRVFIFPGSRDHVVGANASGRVFAEGDGSIPGVAENGDMFGQALATGDFNGDGTTDLAIGVPGENTGKGGVMVIRGSGTAALLSPTAAKYWSQGTSGVLGTPNAGDNFGYALATGDFLGNGRTDLAIGVPNEDVDGVVDEGAVNVLLSAGSSGLSATGNELFEESSTGPANSGAQYGFSLAAGDFNGDNATDLAIGAPKTESDNDTTSGLVQILKGSSTGLSGSINTRWSGDDPAILGTPGDYDRYGAALVPLRVSTGTRDDLLIAAPGIYTATVNDDEYNGMLELLFSSANGLTGTGAQTFKCETPGLLGGCDLGDLGDSLA